MVERSSMHDVQESSQPEWPVASLPESQKPEFVSHFDEAMTVVTNRIRRPGRSGQGVLLDDGRTIPLGEYLSSHHFYGLWDQRQDYFVKSMEEISAVQERFLPGRPKRPSPKGDVALFDDSIFTIDEVDPQPDQELPLDSSEPTPGVFVTLADRLEALESISRISAAQNTAKKVRKQAKKQSSEMYARYGSKAGFIAARMALSAAAVKKTKPQYMQTLTARDELITAGFDPTSAKDIHQELKDDINDHLGKGTRAKDRRVFIAKIARPTPASTSEAKND